MADHRDAPKHLEARMETVRNLPLRAGRNVAAAVAGHRGDSTVSVVSAGKGAKVTISGPDAAEHRAAVHKDATRAITKGQ